jgi:predicted RND superfamily exporter protein
MNKIWLFFWKFFAAALIAALAVSVILGIVNNSSEVAYAIAQKVMVVGIGVCGIIGIIVVPVELYLIDRAERGKNNGCRAAASGGGDGIC